MATGMKVVILAGGRGSRLGSLTDDRPKPLVNLGGLPIVCHVMRHFLHFGFADFLIAAGYRGDQVAHLFGRGDCLPCQADAGAEDLIPGSVRVVPTGPDSASAGRLLQLHPFLGGTTFMLAWCDGLTDLPLDELLAFHRGHGRLATVVAVHPPARFGILTLAGDKVSEFREKPAHIPLWINGGFFVLEPGALDSIQDPAESWEEGALQRLAAAGELMAFRHAGYWRCMDTAAEHAELDRLCLAGRPPWQTWN